MSEEVASLELCPPDPPARAGRPRYLHPATGYEHLGIFRRTFFRWLELGDACQDWPPFDSPAEIDAWWQRMRGRGLVKNSLPSKVAEKIALCAAAGGGFTASEALPSPAGEAASAPGPAVSSSPPPPGHALASGFDPQRELREAENRVVALREARDAAYAANQRDDGDRLDRLYWEKYAEYSAIAKRVNEMLEKSGELVRRSVVEADLAPRIVGIAVGGMFFYAQIQTRLAAAASPAEQNKIWRAFWREKVGALLQSRYVPEFLRAAPDHLWAEALALIESRRPADLALTAD